MILDIATYIFSQGIREMDLVGIVRKGNLSVLRKWLQGLEGNWKNEMV